MCTAPIASASTMQAIPSTITGAACAAIEEAMLCTRTMGVIAPDSRDSRAKSTAASSARQALKMRERAKTGRWAVPSRGATASAKRGGEGSEGGDGGADGGASLSSSDSSVRLVPALLSRL
eukprot:920696-Pleurochrysis_carterae.AAC.1